MLRAGLKFVEEYITNFREGCINTKYKIQNTKFPFRRRRKGFTLTEIIIVLGIVGIIISGILPLFVNVIAAGKSAAHYSTAYKLADSKIEEYRNASFDNLADETATITELPDGSLTATVTNEIDGSTETDIKRVELTINWSYQRDREIKIVTYVYRGGL
jgi:prepilin-type N-terminal cleavage/methylation domain-containing protein